MRREFVSGVFDVPLPCTSKECLKASDRKCLVVTTGFIQITLGRHHKFPEICYGFSYLQLHRPSSSVEVQK